MQKQNPKTFYHCWQFIHHKLYLCFFISWNWSWSFQSNIIRLYICCAFQVYYLTWHKQWKTRFKGGGGGGILEDMCVSFEACLRGTLGPDSCYSWAWGHRNSMYSVHSELSSWVLTCLQIQKRWLTLAVNHFHPNLVSYHVWLFLCVSIFTSQLHHPLSSSWTNMSWYTVQMFPKCSLQPSWACFHPSGFASLSVYQSGFPNTWHHRLVFCFHGCW